jgi:hypothetical protein
MTDTNTGSTQAPAPTPSPVRFKIASRLGALKDTMSFSDPFGTGARFHIRRKGSKAHREWSQEYIDSDAYSSAYLEQLVTGHGELILNDEESQVVEESRAGDPANQLVKIIDRLTATAAEHNTNTEAIRKAVATGRTSYSRILRADKDKQLEEAVFLLSGWDSLPGEDDSPIPYSLAAARDLLTSDVPLEGSGFEEVILAHPEWCKTVKIEGQPTITIPIPGLTLGQAYILWTHARSEAADLFREMVLEEAGKNSLPPSTGSISPGGGTSETDSSSTA